MAQGNRQSNLFAAEDFTVLYDSFANSNFKAYDFDTIRAAMINYVQKTYPEEYNDWIQSSEFVANLDLVAWFGHNLAFRLDFATRENYFSTAQRRESLIRQANLVNYRAKRNIPAYGYVKIVNARTSEEIYDSSGIILQNKNTNFESTDDYENFITVMNSIFQSSNPFGTPTSRAQMDNETVDFYRMNSRPGIVTIGAEGKANGVNSKFELVSIGYNETNDTIVESHPNPAAGFDIMYKDNRTGIAGDDTGFFMGIKQGTLSYVDYSLETPTSNQILDIAEANINDTDVFVQTVDSTGTIVDNWTYVNTLTGSNVVYNSLTSTDRNLFSVETRAENRVSVKFGDGLFANIPSGIIRVWYRVSKNESYILRPNDVTRQVVSFKYTGKDGNTHTAQLTVELRDTISTASSNESTEEIRINAPLTYGSQDRMVNAEDYTVYPFSVSNNIKKIKAVNRTHSGHSRFVESYDPTGNYQDVRHFGDDGIIYNYGDVKTTSLDVPSGVSNNAFIEKHIEPMLADGEMINLYYSKFAAEDFLYTSADTSNGQTAYKWQKQSNNTGYFTSGIANDVQRVGKAASGDKRYIKPGSLCKFVVDTTTDKTFVVGSITSITVVNQGSGYTSPTVTIIGAGTGATATATVVGGKIVGFNVTAAGSGYDEHTFVQITDSAGTGASARTTTNELETIWARIVSVSDDGLGVDDPNGNSTGVTDIGLGAIGLNKEVPSAARLASVHGAWNTVFTEAEKSKIADALALNQGFGLRYDVLNSTWHVIDSNNIPVNNKANNSTDNFSLANAGASNNLNNDQSWIIRVNYNKGRRTIISRIVRFVFESAGSTQFYIANDDARLDPVTGKPKRDSITILANNNRPNNSYAKLKKWYKFNTYANVFESDGHADGRKVLLSLGNPDNNNLPDNPSAYTNITGTETITIGDVVENGYTYERYSTTGSRTVTGRTNLNFKYDHVATINKRLDPSSSNIIDIFVLTQTYHNEFNTWLVSDGRSVTKPLTPSTDDLRRQFSTLDSKKSASDTIVYRPVKYRILFGDTADSSLRATFRIVQVPGNGLTETEIKSRVINAINDYFDPNNWDFGETFYFTELSAYIHQQLVGVVASFVIVPQDSESVFGSLFQIKSSSDEIFINGANVGHIDIVDNLTRTNLKATDSGQLIGETSRRAETGIYTSSTGGTGLVGGS